MLKRIIFSILICLAFQIHAYAQVPRIIQSAAQASNTTCVFSSNVTSGHVLVLSSGWASSSSAPTISDLLGTSFSQKIFNTSNPMKVALYIGTAIASGPNTITFTVAGSSQQNPECSEWDFGGMSTLTDTFVVNAFSNQTSFSISPILTTQNGDFLLSGCVLDQNGPADNPVLPDFFLSRGHNVTDSARGFRVAGLAGSYTSTYSFNGHLRSGTIFLIAFKPTALQVTTQSLPDAIQGQSYSYTLGAQGGSGPYTWSITGGSLPTGLALSGSGVISGIATHSNQNVITFQATDGTFTSSAGYTLRVGASAGTVNHIQDSNFGPSGLIFPGSVTQGHLLIVSQASTELTSQGIAKCTDTLGTDFRLSMVVVVATGGADSNILMLYSGIAPSTGADTLACSSGDTSYIRGAEFSNLQNFTDSQVYSSGTGTTLTSGTLTPLALNALLYSGSITELDLPTVVPPCTQIMSSESQTTCYQVATSITGYTTSFTIVHSDNWAVMLESFRPAAAGTAPQGKIRRRVNEY